MRPDDKALCDAYRRVDVPLDDLAYSPAFEQLLELVDLPNADLRQHHEVWRRLLHLRKWSGEPKLPSIRRRRPR